LRSVFGIVHWGSCDEDQADWDLDICVLSDLFYQSQMVTDYPENSFYPDYLIPCFLPSTLLLHLRHRVDSLESLKLPGTRSLDSSRSKAHQHGHHSSSTHRHRCCTPATSRPTNTLIEQAVVTSGISPTTAWRLA
jgi:hypothetical protein